MPVIDKVTLDLIEREIAHIKDGKTVQIKVIKSKKYGLLSNRMEELVSKIANISAGKIKIYSEDGAEHPHVQIAQNIFCYAIPSGYLSGVFIHFVVDMVKGEFLAGNDIIADVKRIKKDVVMEVYTSSSCSISPPAIRWALEFGYANRRIRVNITDCVLFPEACLRKGITSTPTIIVNNKVKIVGAPTPDELLRKINLAIS
ncbi:MAG: thioredoxin family protein [Candidatus Micrarchaeia archaeon]